MTRQIYTRPSGVKSRIADATFDEFTILQEAGFEVISLADNARLMIQQGKDSHFAQKETYVREGIIYIPSKKHLLVRNSPILESFEDAVNAHMKGNEFYPTKDQIERALVDYVEFPKEDIQIPTNRFGSEELTVYVFGGENQARAYGEFLQSAGITKMPIWASKDDVHQQSSLPFVRQLWFNGLGNVFRSGLDGYGGDIWGASVKFSTWRVRFLEKPHNLDDVALGEN